MELCVATLGVVAGPIGVLGSLPYSASAGAVRAVRPGIVRTMSEPARPILGGRYQLVDRVGSGGMGTVWRARDQLLGREVAVKQILLPQGLDAEQLDAARGRALREARAAAQVRHPAVVTIYDVVIENDQPWIVMEFVKERSLDDRLRDEKRLPVPEVARIGAALVDALTAIHSQGILHRDVKPGNVLVGDGGLVVLTDFGLATIEGDPRLTATNLLIGTPGYMAPERLAGDPVGPASDLWSLGAVLYAAAEGRSPYDGRTPVVVASAVLTGEPRPTRRSGALAPVISALLARDPADRMDAPTAARRLAELAAGDSVGGSGERGRAGTGAPRSSRPAPPVEAATPAATPAPTPTIPRQSPDLVAPGGAPATPPGAGSAPDPAAPPDPVPATSPPAAQLSPPPSSPPTPPVSPPVSPRTLPPVPPPVETARTEALEPVPDWGGGYGQRRVARTPLARLMFYGGMVLLALAVLGVILAALM